MSIEHILAEKGHTVITVEPERTLLETARLLAEKRIGAVVVPRFNSFIGEPDRQTAALPQAGVISWPVRDLALLPWDLVTARLVQLEGQGEHPRLEATGV